VSEQVLGGALSDIVEQTFGSVEYITFEATRLSRARSETRRA